MTSVTGAGSHQGRRSRGHDAALCVLSNLSAAWRGCARTHRHTHTRLGKSVGHGASDLLARLAAAAAAAAQSRRVATALAEQTAAAVVVIFPGCLFAHPHWSAAVVAASPNCSGVFLCRHPRRVSLPPCPPHGILPLRVTNSNE